MFDYAGAMARQRTIPDETIFRAIRSLLIAGGEKAASFAAVSRATGLAAASLAQRYGTHEGMIRAALLQGWADLMQRTEAAEAEAPLSTKGIPTLLKLIGRGHEAEISLLVGQLRDPDLGARAGAWRARIEAALQMRLDGAEGQRGESAAMIFAAWQGRLLWAGPGKPGFRLKTVARRLA